MSPILVRPVREQLEHDRVIRLLQAKYKRKFEVAINPGNERAMPVGPGPSPWFPDLVLQAPDRGHKLLGVVEVETAESVNHLEAMSQWVALSRFRVAFHLYVPVSSTDSARRLCNDFKIPVAEFWTYQMLGDQMRFTLVQRSATPEAKRGSSEAPARVGGAAKSPAASRAVAGRARPGKPAAAAPRRAPVTPARRKPAAKARVVAKAAPRGRAAKKTVSASKPQKRR